jgi:hypothetical protein
MDDFSLARPAGHLIMGDGSGPDGLATKDGAKALSGAASVDTATTQVDQPSRTKNLITEYEHLRFSVSWQNPEARYHLMQALAKEAYEIGLIAARLLEYLGSVASYYERSNPNGR